jgi:chemotaxis response regulator CheB
MAALASLQAAEEVINGIAAVVNGVIAPVLLVFVMVVAHDRRVMGERVPGPLLLGLGASTGGPRALAKLLSALPRDFPLPIAVVQHMAEDFFDSFVRFLRDASGLPVEQANAATHFEPGHVYVAPPRQEMFVKENLTVKLLPPPPNSIISPYSAGLVT